MDITIKDRKIFIENKVISELDEFALDFVRMLEHFTEYVIVSGYVCILFGRARGTEDIDILIPSISDKKFSMLYNGFMEKEYFILNPEEEYGLFKMLEDGLGIRIAEKNTIIPNIKLKFIKDNFDRFSFHNKMEVLLNSHRLFISPFELQIPYKLYLGSNKDIEDAVYLWELVKDHIDEGLLEEFMETFQVQGDVYGITFR
ncbi:MAG: hypothetical protein HXS53_09890 [Theionarchaea archaeon]|nr:hypothetical protein [Theionarchaea archaeon]